MIYIIKSRFVRKRADVQLSHDDKIKDKHPEEIVKPGNVLKIILGRYFSYNRNKNKNKKYSKLKDGADLLTILNSSELQKTFTDFNKLILKIEHL